MANKEYSSNADKTEPEKTLTFFFRTEIPLKHKAKSHTPRVSIHFFTTYHELRTTHRFPTSPPQATGDRPLTIAQPTRVYGAGN